MANARYVMLTVFAIALAAIAVDAQLDSIKNFANSVGDALTCPSKISEDCTLEKSTDQDDNDKRVVCCTYIKFERCVQNSAEKHCPGTPISGLMNSLAKIDSGACENYSFWSPECLYTNYLLVLIGTTGGLIALGIIACVACYCCCCRRK